MAEKPVDALTEAEARAELAALAQRIAAANRAYHTEDAPEISDAEYDGLKRRNAAIEARYPALLRADSPSARVGGAVAEGFGKIRHRVPMLSLENAFTACRCDRFRRPGAQLPRPCRRACLHRRAKDRRAVAVAAL
jgi:DNA ligase (NAD+)